jgi:hypothetical protein
MLISHEHKFIFVHVPRTGGTSVEKSLGLAVGISDWKLQNGTPQQHLTSDDLTATSFVATSTVRGMKHATAREIRAHVGEDIWSTYFKFAVVRNPLDRTLSVYLKNLKAERFNVVRPLARTKLVFNTALRLKYQLLGKNADLQADFLCESGKLIVDEVIRFEHLAEDYARIATQFGLDPALSNNNDGTRHNHYLSYYKSSTRKLVERVKLPDFQLFGYPTSVPHLTQDSH